MQGFSIAAGLLHCRITGSFDQRQGVILVVRYMINTLFMRQDEQSVDVVRFDYYWS